MSLDLFPWDWNLHTSSFDFHYFYFRAFFFWDRNFKFSFRKFFYWNRKNFHASKKWKISQIFFFYFCQKISKKNSYSIYLYVIDTSNFMFFAFHAIFILTFLKIFNFFSWKKCLIFFSFLIMPAAFFSKFRRLSKGGKKIFFKLKKKCYVIVNGKAVAATWVFWRRGRCKIRGVRMKRLR